MHKKLLHYIIAAFVILAAIASFPYLFGRSDEKMTFEKQKNLSVYLADYTESSVERINIAKGDDEKVLSHKDGVWRIGDDEADGGKVRQLFDGFSKMKIGEAVSENEKNYAKFDVNREAGIMLTISQNGRDNLFFIGKAGASQGEFYIRKDGIKNVYLVESAGLRDLLLGDGDQWKKADESKSENPEEKTI